MSNLERYTGGALPSRASRSIRRIETNTSIENAVINSRAEIEMVKLDNVAAIAGQAMRDVALVSQLEQSLAQTVPHASGRLAAIADMSALSMSDVVANAARRISR